MRTIHKHTLDVRDTATWRIELHEGAKLLHVDVQDNRNVFVQTWWEVETDRPVVTRAFRVAGTGEPLPQHCHHIGTALGAPFVWHLYEYAELPQLSAKG